MTLARLVLGVPLVLAACFVAWIMWPASDPPVRPGDALPATPTPRAVGDGAANTVRSGQGWSALPDAREVQAAVDALPPPTTVPPTTAPPPTLPPAPEVFVDEERIEPNIELAPAITIERDPAMGPDYLHPFLVCTRYYESDRGPYPHTNGYAVVGGPHHGAYQFLPATFDETARRAGRPDLVGVLPSLASPADQDAMALALYGRLGNQPWGGRC